MSSIDIRIPCEWPQTLVVHGRHGAWGPGDSVLLTCIKCGAPFVCIAEASHDATGEAYLIATIPPHAHGEQLALFGP